MTESLLAQSNWVHSEVNDDATPFFDDSYVHDIYITIDDEDWYNTLYTSHDTDIEDPYFEADFEADGVVLHGVGIRFKGNSSFNAREVKKSFKVDFNEYASTGNEDQTFFGMKKLNLNINYKDPSMMREKLFMDFASNFVEGIGRSVFTNVHVNGELWGVFSAVEQIDKVFIQSRFGHAEDGNLYKGTISDDSVASDDFNSDMTWLGVGNDIGSTAAIYDDFYQLKTNETAYDYTQFEELLYVLNNTSTEDLPTAIEPLLDVYDTLANLALNNLFSNTDSYIGSAHNFYLYDRDDTGQFTHLLWDENESFGTFARFLDRGDDMEELDPFWIPSGEERPLMENLWAVDKYSRAYLQDLAEMLREGFDADSALVQINYLADVIRNDVEADNYKQYNTAQFEANLTSDITSGRSRIYGLSSFIETKAAYLNAELDKYATNTDLSLNELMPVNVSTAQDSAGDFDPWIEIYNAGPGLVSMSGLYLTDDTSNLTKWSIPTSNLNDGEFLVIWLDGETSEGADHASFTLSATGGVLQLTDGTTVIDTITYHAAVGDVSLARLPNGNGDWSTTDNPTIGSSNLTGTLQPVEIHINEVMADNETTIEDPSELDSFEDWIELYNSGTEEVDLSGMYLSDDVEDPTQWQFSEGTTVAAGGHLIIWADKDEEAGLTHAGFKLSNNGETLTLYHIDGMTLIDTITFKDHRNDISYGRFPDGGEVFHSMSTPTPGTSNVAGYELTDTVDDGITDAWRAENFGGTGTTVTSDSEATADPDEDGHSNLEEYLAGTDPNDNSSFLTITGKGDSIGYEVSFGSSADRFYTLWHSTNLMEGNWNKIDGMGSVIGTGSVHSLVDTLPEGRMGFYRVEIELP